MKTQDRTIGLSVYGWTEEPTEINDWHDAFFDIYRPKPIYKKDLYPSWSSSNQYALDLISYLAQSGVKVRIGQSGVGYRVWISLHDIGADFGEGDTIPEALGNAVCSYADLGRVPIYNLAVIKQSLERSL